MTSIAHPCLASEEHFSRALQELVVRSGGESCLERVTAPTDDGAQSPSSQLATVDGAYRLAQLPIYVTHAPYLAQRRRAIMSRLRGLNASDVTIVKCGNRDEIEKLPAELRACLYSPTYNPFDKGKRTIANGTLSLALKHRLAYWDLTRRKLGAALLLEDDASVPSNLWSRLRAFAIPTDADIFYLGSYQGLTNWNVLKWDPVVPGTSPHVHRRSCKSKGRVNKHFGTIAYIVFERAAHSMLRSVRVAADSGLSAMNCSSGCSFCADTPSRQYGPASWLIAPDRRVVGAGNTHRDGR